MCLGVRLLPGCALHPIRLETRQPFTCTTAMNNMYNRIVSKKKSGWDHLARQDFSPFDLARCCIIKSAAAALCFQWIRQVISLPNRDVISKLPLKDIPHGVEDHYTDRREPLTDVGGSGKYSLHQSADNCPVAIYIFQFSPLLILCPM